MQNIWLSSSFLNNLQIGPETSRRVHIPRPISSPPYRSSKRKDRREMVRSCSPCISPVINLPVKNGWVCCCMQISRPGRQRALLHSPPESREQTASWYMGHQVSTGWCMDSGSSPEIRLFALPKKWNVQGDPHYYLTFKRFFNFS